MKITCSYKDLSVVLSIMASVVEDAMSSEDLKTSSSEYTKMTILWN